jgi:predicted molibdopterin-dependent oxidoreductase YjgC
LRTTPESLISINPKDAKKLDIKEGETVTVRSRRGEVDIRARITRKISEGLVFIPMHYHEAAANILTNDALDPKVKIPEMKVCAVKITHGEKGINDTLKAL